jgi:hypothetical protein
MLVDFSQKAYTWSLSNESSFRHQIGGTSSFVGAICPNCEKPLTLFFSLDRSDRRVPLATWNTKCVELLYCWCCQLSEGYFSYRVECLSDIPQLEIIEQTKGESFDDFPYADYPRQFESKSISLVEVEESTEALKHEYAKSILAGDDDFWDELDQEQRDIISADMHQLFGVPYLHDFAEKCCPICGLPMKFLATVADDAGHGERFIGAECVQVVFTVCESCRVISARNECD